jgi:hypothetical protein
MTALLASLNPARSIGFFPEFQVALPLNYRKHTSDLAFDLPAYLDPSFRLEDFAAPPRFPAEAGAIASRIRDLLPPSMRVLAVHPETAINKMWPAERFVAVFDAFLAKHPEFVAMVISQGTQGLDGGRMAAGSSPAAGCRSRWRSISWPRPISFSEWIRACCMSQTFSTCPGSPSLVRLAAASSISGSVHTVMSTATGRWIRSRSAASWRCWSLWSKSIGTVRGEAVETGGLRKIHR